MKSAHMEHILAFDKQRFMLGSGFTSFSIDFLKKYGETAAMFARRFELETDENFGQAIPYVILTQRGNIFAYQRTELAGEERLHGNISVGFGGHVGFADLVQNHGVLNLTGTLNAAMFRELNEEIILDYRGEKTISFRQFYEDQIRACETPEQAEELKPELLGMINDTSNEVGRVHYAIVFRYEIPSDYRPACAEKELSNIGWIDPKVLVHTEKIENWSRIVLENAKLDRTPS